MKKSKLFALGANVAFMIAALASCGQAEAMDSQRAKVEAAVADAMTLTRDELFQKAADEIQGGTLKWVGCSSRFAKAGSSFKEALAAKNPACANMTLPEKVGTDDGKIYGILADEIRSKIADGNPGALVQDGYQLQKYGINTKYFINYVPKEWKDSATDKTGNEEPFALQYQLKTWLVNDAEGKVGSETYDNVWDFVVPTANKILMMNPNTENVNRDYLIMLTQEKYCDILKEAYDDPSAPTNKPDLAPYEQYGAKQKYAYAFIAGFIERATFFADDGGAVDTFAPKSNAGAHGWIVYSKMMNLNETENISRRWIVSPALGKENTDGATSQMQMKGFGGFMYKHYLQVMPYTQYPYTACAFINHMSTTAAGYKAWATDLGSYPSMGDSININRKKLGHGHVDSETGKFVSVETEENYAPVMNDPSGDWWVNQGKAVIEDPAYLAEAHDAVNEFIVNETIKKSN